ncbi:NUDIX domain-containing protein [Ilyomonas limi]|uniref:NUDIX domain-containing protein n=1 Tax=Ilyomonas limi TaxID=2575867 RepID=A0A4U3KPX5_9BACT|nr:NUDIX domain-containing protein [Ilyomonas limi]TKK64278.1 NUDIX domain-containing protein [Ilyomonas limi]
MKKKTIVAAGGLVSNDAGELLLIYRRGFWDLPKGKLDEGETIEACAIREVREETGLTDVQLGKLVGITYHEYFDKWIQCEVIKETHWFVMYAGGTQQLVPQHDEDIEDIKWVARKDVTGYLQHTYKNIVDIINQYYASL